MKYIGLIGYNSIEYIETILNVWNDGNCIVLIDVNTPFETLLEQLKLTNSLSCFVDEEVYNKNNNLFESCKNIKFNVYKSNRTTYLFLPEYIYEKYNYNYSFDPAVVIFSSGTTGDAKGIELSHYAISINADMIYSSMNISKNESLYILKKFSHSSTLVGEVLLALRNKLKLLIGPIIIPTRIILLNIIKYNISIICVNPTLLKLIIAEINKKYYDIKSLKKIFISGDKLYKKDCLNSRKRLPNIEIYNMYGLTEAGPRVSMQSEEYCSENSVGTPLNGVQIKIMSKSQKNCKNYEKGIVYVKTPTRFLKYSNNFNKLNNMNSEWINTGDIGYFNNKGELFITDRIDDVIIINAHKIYPSDIENKIIELLNIEECVIISNYNKKSKNDVLICIYVGDKIDVKYIVKKLRNYFLEFEIPKIYLKVDSIPKNKNGKRDIKKLKNIIEEVYENI